MDLLGLNTVNLKIKLLKHYSSYKSSGIDWIRDMPIDWKIQKMRFIPKLSELHYKLFGTQFDEAHNAAVDINATAKCFWQMKTIGVL